MSAVTTDKLVRPVDRARRRRSAADRTRPFHRRPWGEAGHAARRHPAFAACACENPAVRTEAARNAPGVAVVLTGEDVTALSASLVVGVKAPIECWPIAVDRVRYVGEPVAVVVAANRYLAEDALDLIEVDYEPLAAIVDPLAALDPTHRSCTTALAPTSRASARSATAILSAPSPKPRAACR